MTPESRLLAEIRNALGRLPHVRLFRRQVALAWQGTPVKTSAPKTVTLYPGDVLLRKARPIHVGVKGMADLGGWRTMTILPNMVGERFAQVVEVEVKSKNGTVEPEQANWVRVVRESGGLAGVARTVAEAEAIIGGETCDGK